MVSATTLASEAGAGILRAGGNAVDAAIATGFALQSTYPQAGNIGGGGFMVIRFPDGTSTTIDFREVAPKSANTGMFLAEDGRYSSEIHHSSHKAIGVPGTVAGFEYAHKKYGSKDWASLVQPAEDLASRGFVVSKRLEASLKRALRTRLKPYPASHLCYTPERGDHYLAGDLILQPDLAKSLARIRLKGAKGFYAGETAALIVAEMQKHGGLITAADLLEYRVKERPAIVAQYRGFDVIGMPPPSSGGLVIAKVLNILEGYDLQSMGHNSAEYIHTVAEAMRMAFRDRARFLGDPDFVSIQRHRFLDKKLAAKERQAIHPNRANPSSPSDIKIVAESPQTTHFSLVDSEGMSVSVTYTLEYSFGSGIVAPGTGFLLNNEMGDFNPQAGMTTSRGHIGSQANLVAPKKRMLSSMSPTILAKDDKLVAVIGSPGGRTIINTVLLTVLNLVDFEMNIEEAVLAPRFHHQWLPDRIQLEANLATPTLLNALKALGHETKVVSSQGRAHCLGVNSQNGVMTLAPDPRDADAGGIRP